MTTQELIKAANEVKPSRVKGCFILKPPVALVRNDAGGIPGEVLFADQVDVEGSRPNHVHWQRLRFWVLLANYKLAS